MNKIIKYASGQLNTPESHVDLYKRILYDLKYTFTKNY